MTVPHRSAPYDVENRLSARVNADYRLSRPKTLRGMLAKAQHEYSMEPPLALHTAGLMDDSGDPAMTGQALSYLGFMRPRGDDRADDWRAIACRRDEDGHYVSPMRCAIESIRDPQRRAFIRDLLTSDFHASDVPSRHGIPEWCATEVTYRSLEMLFEQYAPRPLPGPSRPRGISDAQADAEASAA